MLNYVLPYPSIDYIHPLEPVDADITNRPMIQIEANLDAVVVQSSAEFLSMGGKISALESAVANQTNGVTSFADLTNIPTTIAGYGITDASSAAHTHTFASLTAKPSTIAGYGITDASPISHVHSFANLTAKPTTIAGYGISDALSIDGLKTINGQRLDGAGDITITGGTGTSTLVIPDNTYITTTAAVTASVIFTSAVDDVVYIYIDSIIQEPQSDYTLTTSAITFTQTLPAGTRILIQRFSPSVTNTGTGGNVVPTKYVSTTTDGQTTYSFAHVTGDVILVYSMGILLDEGTEYSLDLSGIVFAEPRTAGEKLTIIKFVA